MAEFQGEKGEPIVEALQLRKTFSLNMRAWRKKLGFSQEKLAELADVSTQTINDIECCRSWMSDATMVKLAKALEVEVFQFFVPNPRDQDEAGPFSLSAALLRLKQDIKTDLGASIDTYIDTRFKRFLTTELPQKTEIRDGK
jgi:transcriptional regulator with XRE-family HTH domain